MARKFSFPKLPSLRKIRFPRISLPRNFALYSLALVTGILLFYALPDFVITLPRAIPQPVLSESDLNKFAGTYDAFSASDAGTSINVSLRATPTGGVQDGVDYTTAMREKLAAARIFNVQVNANTNTEEETKFLDVTLQFPKRQYAVDYEQVSKFLITSEGASDVVNMHLAIGVDFSLLGSHSTLSNFQQGRGLYSDIVVSYAVDDVGVLDHDAALINRRIQAAGMADVYLTIKKSNTANELQFSFPAHYGPEIAEQMSLLFVQKGVLSILKHQAGAGQPDETLDSVFSGYTPVTSTLGIGDIASLRIEPRAAQGIYVWRATFKPDARTRLDAEILSAGYVTSTTTTTTSAEVMPMIITIDGSPALVLAYPEGNDMLALPYFVPGGEIPVRIMSTYVLDGQGLIGDYASPLVTRAASMLAQEPVTVFVALAVAALVSLIGLTWKLPRRHRGRFLLGALFAIAFFVSLFKFTGTILSLLFVLFACLWIAGMWGWYWHTLCVDTKERKLILISLWQRLSVAIFLSVLTVRFLVPLSGMTFEFAYMLGFAAIISIGIGFVWQYLIDYEN